MSNIASTALVRGRDAALPESFRGSSPRDDPTSIFVEARVDQFFELLHCFVRVWSLATDTQFRPLPGSEHHQAHDAFAIYFLAFLRNPNFRSMTARDAHKHGGRPGM